MTLYLLHYRVCLKVQRLKFPVLSYAYGTFNRTIKTLNIQHRQCGSNLHPLALKSNLLTAKLSQPNVYIMANKLYSEQFSFESMAFFMCSMLTDSVNMEHMKNAYVTTALMQWTKCRNIEFQWASESLLYSYLTMPKLSFFGTIPQLRAADTLKHQDGKSLRSTELCYVQLPMFLENQLTATRLALPVHPVSTRKNV